ncbi:MAG: UbiX family flavin prenyltransferase [Eubacteriales bacterium]
MKKIVLAITGASGTIYGIRILEELKKNKVETHVVFSDAANTTMKLETDYDLSYIENLADFFYSNADVHSAIASGSFITDGMIVAPCSIKTLSGIANCYSENLIQRAADVTLKEHRNLVLMVRETPFHLGHIELMRKASQIGAIILPPVTAMYTKPETVDDIVNHTVGKALDLMKIENNIYKRWK